MKIKIIILFCSVIILSNFCRKDHNERDPGLNCSILKEGILNSIFDSDSISSIIKLEIDKLTMDLTPKPTDSDKLGQLSNFDTLFKRLEICDSLSFIVCCYGCIQTGILQTEVAVLADSCGKPIKRLFDFYTSDRMNLTFRYAHVFTFCDALN